ncbi:HU family DNA-binding protein [Parabacteroides distasonis]|nr:HU family DNA-binding protein [Parabacteroides distasonis]
MNNRLSITDLASLLATATSKNKRDTELFLRTLIVLVTRKLFEDKIVKVKGIGTFKLVQVEARESVRVQTGERFVIPAHYKFTFVPDKEIKDRVNKPFSFFEVTELNKQVDFPDLQETEEDETAESDEASVEELPVSGRQEMQAVPDQSDQLEVPVTSAPETSENGTASSIAPTAPEMIQETPAADTLETPETMPQEQQESPTERSTRRWSWIRWMLLSLLVVGGIGCWLFYRQIQTKDLGQEKDSLHQSVPQPIDSMLSESIEFPAEPEESDQTISTELDTLSADSLVQQSGEIAVAADSVLAHVQIALGDRLTTIALTYYGHKIFWVYLYEHNKDHIKDPNNIPIGTDIAIPAPQLYGIDAQNAGSIREATQKQTEILSQID